MTLISPIYTSMLRPVAVQPLAANTQQVLAVTAVRPTTNGWDRPDIPGVTLDHIPFIGDEAILIDDLTQPPIAPEPTTVDQPKAAIRVLTETAERSYLEAKAVTGNILDTGLEKAEQDLRPAQE